MPDEKSAEQPRAATHTSPDRPVAPKEDKATKAAEAQERGSLAQMLRDGGSKPSGENLYSEDDIKEALDGGLTRDDIEWNQRLNRPWTHKAKDGDEEQAARAAYYGAPTA